MRLLLLTAACYAAGAGASAIPPATGVSATERIINGVAAAAGAFPAAVSLEVGFVQGQGLCGGTLISSTVVVTAGHCVFDFSDGKVADPSTIQVGYGNNSRSQQDTATVRSVHVHPDFTQSQTTNDIAVIIIDPLPASSGAVPAEIFTGPLPEGTDLTAVGWGLTSATDGIVSLPDLLQETTIAVGSRDSCRKLVPTYESSNGPQICTENTLHPGSDTCQGDSGSGVYVTGGGRPQLAGLTSFGASPEGDPTCALSDGLAIYTHVNYYRPFLAQFLDNPAAKVMAPLSVMAGRLRHHHHHHHHHRHGHHRLGHPSEDADDTSDEEAGPEHTHSWHPAPEHTWTRA